MQVCRLQLTRVDLLDEGWTPSYSEVHGLLALRSFSVVLVEGMGQEHSSAPRGFPLQAGSLGQIFLVEEAQTQAKMIMWAFYLSFFSYYFV